MKFPNPITALKAFFRFAKLPEIVPQLVELGRGFTCHSCEHNVDNQCQKCTCFIPLKIKLSTESCPLGKWKQYFNATYNGIQNV